MFFQKTSILKHTNQRLYKRIQTVNIFNHVFNMFASNSIILYTIKSYFELELVYLTTE